MAGAAPLQRIRHAGGDHRTEDRIAIRRLNIELSFSPAV